MFGQKTFYLINLAGIIEEEVQCPDEIWIVVVFVVFLVEGEHLVGRRGKQENANLGMFKERGRQHGGFVIAIQQVLESLELIKDDQIGLKR